MKEEKIKQTSINSQVPNKWTTVNVELQKDAHKELGFTDVSTLLA